nr:hypothetical protein CFP56_04297 [Quercus suber]
MYRCGPPAGVCCEHAAPSSSAHPPPSLTRAPSNFRLSSCTPTAALLNTSRRPWVSSLPIHSFDSSVLTHLRKRRHAAMATTATATAVMAAAGFDKRPCTSTISSSSTLQTPGSASFPSELRSPMVSSPGGFLKRDQDLKTPITPPSAYLDFLKSMSPAMLSPAPTSTSARFSFNEKPSESFGDKTMSPPTSDAQPSLSRNTSYDSNASTVSTSTVQSVASTSSAASLRRTRPASPRIAIPLSSFAKPGPRSARTPRKLQIPQSPFSPAVPPSAHSICSPYASTPLSGVPWSATSFSPVDPEANGKPGKVSVRQVVTRTVTYCRTPLEPAPRGKRRKIEVEESSRSGTSKESSAEPPIKQEKLSTDTKVLAAPKADKA